MPLPDQGRRFARTLRVRLGDVDDSGTLRLDGVARYLQDVASDDWEDTGESYGDTWVARRTALRLVPGASWPTLGSEVTITTWCGGFGAAWAERRTTIALGGAAKVEAAAIWVPVDDSGHPRRLQQTFFDVYGEAARGRRVSGRIAAAPVPDGVCQHPWTIRRADLDVLGHVNNAALWCAMCEVTTGIVHAAELSFHKSVEFGEDVTLAHDERHLWLLVGEDLRVSGVFDAG